MPQAGCRCGRGGTRGHSNIGYDAPTDPKAPIAGDNGILTGTNSRPHVNLSSNLDECKRAHPVDTGPCGFPAINIYVFFG